MDFKHAVVRILVTEAEPSYIKPWSAARIKNSSGTGFGIKIKDQRFIITNAHVIENAVYIKVYSDFLDKKYRAVKYAIGDDCDLCLLSIEDSESFWSVVDTLEIGKMGKPRQAVTVYGFPKGGEKICVTEGKITRIEIGDYCHLGNNLLEMQISSSINNGSSGGPVLGSDGKIVGVIHQSNGSGQLINYMIPSNVINHFITDVIMNGHNYKGFPYLGISTETMENDCLRGYFGMGVSESGVLVTKVDKLSDAFGILKKDDIIMYIDNIKIKNDGTIKTDFSSGVSYEMLILDKHIGSFITVTFRREGRVLNEFIKLTNGFRNTKLISSKEYNKKPRFYINTGVIFVPLTYNYIAKQKSKRWNHLLYDDKDSFIKEPVIIIKVLENKYTSGYNKVCGAIVTKINDNDIICIKDVKIAFESNESAVHVIKLENNKTIVFDAVSKEEQNKILSLYSMSNSECIDEELF